MVFEFLPLELYDHPMKVLLNLNQAVVLHRIDPLKFDQNPIALETPSLAAATPTVTPVEIAGTIMTHAVRAMIEMILAGKKLVGEEVGVVEVDGVPH